MRIRNEQAANTQALSLSIMELSYIKFSERDFRCGAARADPAAGGAPRTAPRGRNATGCPTGPVSGA